MIIYMKKEKGQTYQKDKTRQKGKRTKRKRTKEKKKTTDMDKTRRLNMVWISHFSPVAQLRWMGLFTAWQAPCWTPHPTTSPPPPTALLLPSTCLSILQHNICEKTP